MRRAIAVAVFILSALVGGCGEGPRQQTQEAYSRGFNEGQKKGFQEGYDRGLLVAAPHRDARLSGAVREAYRWASIVGGGLILITLAVVTLYLIFRSDVEAAAASIGALAALGAIAAFFLSPAAGLQAQISEQLFAPAGGAALLNLVLSLFAGVAISWSLYAAIKALRGMVLDGAMAVIMSGLCVLVGQELFVAWNAGAELWSFRAGAILVGGCLGAGFFFAFRSLAAIAKEHAPTKKT